MRVLVTGGRDYTSYEHRMWLYAGLNLLHGMTPITEIIEGGAKGFDSHAYNWLLWKRACCGDQLDHTHMPANWEKHGKAAGHIRNAEMAALKPDIVLACPGGVGTAGMVAISKAQGLRVIALEKMPVPAPRERGPVSEAPQIVVVDAA